MIGHTKKSCKTIRSDKFIKLLGLRLNIIKMVILGAGGVAQDRAHGWHTRGLEPQKILGNTSQANLNLCNLYQNVS
jgi:hypothetical protein